MFRGSYGTGFRVPTFNQIFNGVTISPDPGNTLVDPTLCPTGNTTGPQPACAPITPELASGGNLNLEPETSEQYSVGVVIQPSSRFSLSVDYWNIAVDNTIGTITIPQLLANIAAFPERIQRTNGIITGVDLRTGNFGSRRTEGMDVTLRGAIDAFDGVVSAGLDGTYLLDKREKLLPNLPYTARSASSRSPATSACGGSTMPSSATRTTSGTSRSPRSSATAIGTSRCRRRRRGPTITRGSTTISSTISRSAIPASRRASGSLSASATSSTAIRPSRSPMTAIPAPAAPGSRASPIRGAARSPWRPR